MGATSPSTPSKSRRAEASLAERCHLFTSLICLAGGGSFDASQEPLSTEGLLRHRSERRWLLPAAHSSHVVRHCIISSKDRLRVQPCDPVLPSILVSLMGHLSCPPTSANQAPVGSLVEVQEEDTPRVRTSVFRPWIAPSIGQSSWPLSF